MKNNIDFYQHYASADQHPKFKMLRVQYGWSGEGKFWALNNRIAQSENCCLNISKKYNKAAIASDLDLNLQEFDEFIHFLLDDCELIKECEVGVITTDIVQETLGRLMVNRGKARERKQRWLEKVSKGSGEKAKSSPEQSKIVEYSKVNKIYSRVVDYLNKKTNSKYKSQTKRTISLIKARTSEGFKPDDFKVVIDYCCSKWIGDEKMQDYLRPETLFSSKFEGYLNAAKRGLNNNPLSKKEVLQKHGF